jgi:hypothetical protein
VRLDWLLGLLLGEALTSINLHDDHFGDQGAAVISAALKVTAQQSWLDAQSR